MHPPARVPCSMVRAATTAPVRPFGVLVIGSTNVCRSPAAEQLLRARLGADAAVAVTSVGTHVPVMPRDVEAPVSVALVPEALAAEVLVAEVLVGRAPVPEAAAPRSAGAQVARSAAPGAARADVATSRTPKTAVADVTAPGTPRTAIADVTAPGTPRTAVGWRTTAEAGADQDVPHTAGRLEPEMVEAADLVLTMSRAERAEVVRLVPGAVRRAFTVRELARVAAHLGPASLPDGDVAARFAALVSAAAPHRGPTAPQDLADDDVADPAGRDEWTRAKALEQVRDAVDTIAAVVRPTGPDGGPAAGAGRAGGLTGPAGMGGAAGPGGAARPDGATGPAGRQGGVAGPARRQGGVAAGRQGGVATGAPVMRAAGWSGSGRGRRGRARLAPRSLHGHPVRRRSRARTVAVAALSSVVVVVISVTAGALVVMDRLDDRVDRFPDPFVGLSSRPAPFSATGQGAAATEQPLTVLVLGSADDVPLEGPQAWALAAEHTDVVMLARVSADRESAQLVTFPPDLAVEVPGSGQGTLRSAFAEGGPPSAVQTVEQLTDVRIDHIALTDSATFARITEALGGVDLDVAADLVQEGQVVVPAGRHRLTGEQALLWVQAAEARDGEEAGEGGADGALAGGRAERQQAWLRAILDRLGGADVRRDPTSWFRLLSVVSDSVAVDEGLDRGTLAGLLTSLRGLRPDDVDVVAAPVTSLPSPEAGGTTGSDVSEPAVVPDAEPFAALMTALRTDTLGEHLAALDGDRP